MANQDDELYTFSDETLSLQEKNKWGWQLLIVDQNEENHARIKNALKEVVCESAGVAFLDAYNNVEAKNNIKANPEIAIVLINLLSDEQRLDVIKYIRDELKNESARVILLSDQANCPMEKNLILHYSIDGYVEIKKIDTTNFFIIVMSSLHFFVSQKKLIQAKSEIEGIMAASKRFVPSSFLKLLQKGNIVDIKLTDHIEKEMTVLFLDIRSFTTLSEFLTPAETFEFINHFLSYLQPHVAASNGFVDKYIGDSVMALFPEKADDAVRAAIEMLKALDRYNLTRLSHYQIPVKIGIGINTGVLTMGVIGFYDRMECTVISDAVNTASRVETLSKKVGVSLLISQHTFAALKEPEKLNYRFLGDMEVTGKHEFVQVYEVYDCDPEEVLALKSRTKKEFEEAIALYKSYDFQGADHLFKKIVALNPHDMPAKYFLNKPK